MAITNLFLLLAETTPSNQWMLSTEQFQDESSVENYITELYAIIETEIKIENYKGYYDIENLKNFFKYFDTERSIYPYPPKVIRNKLSYAEWEDWQETIQQSSDKEYTIFHQPIEKHTFCEMSERMTKEDMGSNYALLNHQACKLPAKISVCINGNHNVDIDNLHDKVSLKQWFAKNRLPQRKFHLYEKHGENGRGNWPNANPLKCYGNEAQELLYAAIGEKVEELFNIDPNHEMFIVFKYENRQEDNQTVYHGYHVDLDTNDVPQRIKKHLKDN